MGRISPTDDMIDNHLVTMAAYHDSNSLYSSVSTLLKGSKGDPLVSTTIDQMISIVNAEAFQVANFACLKVTEAMEDIEEDEHGQIDSIERSNLEVKKP